MEIFYFITEETDPNITLRCAWVPKSNLHKRCLRNHDVNKRDFLGPQKKSVSDVHQVGKGYETIPEEFGPVTVHKWRKFESIVTLRLERSLTNKEHSKNKECPAVGNRRQTHVLSS